MMTRRMRLGVRGGWAGCGVQREGWPDWAATEALSAAWLPPKDPSCFSPSLPAPSLSSLLLLSCRSFTLRFLLFLHPFLHLLLVWAITDTQRRWWDRDIEMSSDKSPARCSGPVLKRQLLNAASGWTDGAGQTDSALYPCALADAVWPKKHIIWLVPSLCARCSIKHIRMC